MLLPVIAIAAMQLVTAVLGLVPTQPIMDPKVVACTKEAIGDLKNIQGSLSSLVQSPKETWEIKEPVFAESRFQVACNDSNAILYTHNALNYHGGSAKSITINYTEVVEAAKYIIDKCTTNGAVSGETSYNLGFARIDITRRKCSQQELLTGGISAMGPIRLDRYDVPEPSTTAEPKHASTASEAASTTSEDASTASEDSSTTSSHSTKTSKPKPKKTASPEPPTTTQEAPETNTKRPTDVIDWGTTTCFQTIPDRRVFSYKIVQDNIDYIAANVKTVARNPGKGNCTRLACHRNSAIFFCNDDGDMHKPLDNPDQIVAGAREVVRRCRSEGTKSTTENVREEYFDMIAGEINHNDNWRVVVQSSLCKSNDQGDQVTALIPPVDTNPKTTQSGKDKSTKSSKNTKPSPRTITEKALDFLRPKTRDDSLTIRAARSCSPPDNTRRQVARRADPPPGYQAHYCWGTLKNASFPAPIEGGIQYLNKVPGRPGIDAHKCDQVSCSYDTAISWCSAHSERFELDTFKQIAAGAQFILDSCDVPADKCWVGHDISGRVYFNDNWSVIVSASAEHC